MHTLRLARRALVLASLFALIVTSAAAAATSASDVSAAAQAQRPTVTVVKRGLTKFWDLDQENSVDKISLKFMTVKILATRRAIPGRDVVESAWVTPVSAVFDQRTVSTSSDILNGGTIRSCSTYRIFFNGIFYKGDFGWVFKNRDTKTKRLSFQYRC